MLLGNFWFMLHKNGVNKISGKDHRLVESVLRVLHSRGISVPVTVLTGQEGAEIINDYISKIRGSARDKNSSLESILAEAERELIPLKKLDGIKKDERACYLVFIQIVMGENEIIANTPYPVRQSLVECPINTSERFEQIVKFLDRCGQSFSWKEELIDSLRQKWGGIFRARKPFTWLERENEEQCRWAWEYLKKLSWGFSRPSTDYLKPITSSEMYLAIYGAFDSWNAGPDSKRLFLSDFNRAWQQKKHRDSRKGKKVCNLVLREEVKQKLDSMAAARGMKINQFVETLIENEHAKTIQLK